MDRALDKAKDYTLFISNDYELTVFMSTDGKHTVSGKATKAEAKAQMWIELQELYDVLEMRKGTKQEQNIKAYNKTDEEKKEEAKAKQEVCAHPNVKVLQVNKDGPNKGKYFKTCRECDKFLGFVPV